MTWASRHVRQCRWWGGQYGAAQRGSGPAMSERAHASWHRPTGHTKPTSLATPGLSGTVWGWSLCGPHCGSWVCSLPRCGLCPGSFPQYVCSCVGSCSLLLLLRLLLRLLLASAPARSALHLRLLVEYPPAPAPARSARVCSCAADWLGAGAMWRRGERRPPLRRAQQLGRSVLQQDALFCSRGAPRLCDAGAASRDKPTSGADVGDPRFSVTDLLLQMGATQQLKGLRYQAWSGWCSCGVPGPRLAPLRAWPRPRPVMPRAMAPCSPVPLFPWRPVPRRRED